MAFCFVICLFVVVVLFSCFVVRHQVKVETSCLTSVI